MADQERATLSSGGTIGHGNYAFTSFADLLIWLKGLALDPSNMRPSHPRHRNQILRVRRLLNTSDAKTPQRTRKFKQDINDGKFAATFGLNIREKSDKRNAKNRRRAQSSSFSCSYHSEGKRVGLQGKQENVPFLAMNDTRNCTSCRKDFSYLSDVDESIEEPDLVKQGNLKSCFIDLVTSSGYTHNTHTSNKEKPNIEFLEALKPLVIKDLDHPNETSLSLGLEKEDMELNQPLKFLQSRATHLPRPVIPIGPRFQAEVPKWDGPTIQRHHIGDDDLRWFGTQVWPMPNATETNTKAIGKGKNISCFRDFTRSTHCVKKHISEAGLLSQPNIGTTFPSLKFDEIDDDVSKSWTLNDEKKPESIVKLNPLSNGTTFQKLVMEQFPSKSIKSMVHYYYNVYTPRHLSLATRYPFGAIDNESDHNEACKNEGLQTSS